MHFVPVRSEEKVRGQVLQHNKKTRGETSMEHRDKTMEKTKNTVRTIILIAFATVVLGQAPFANATEGGGSAYPGGNEDFMSGALPPAGTYMLLYNIGYSADSLNDNSGDEIPIDFDLDVYGSVLRIVHTTQKQFLGADVAWHVIIPFLHYDVGIGALGVDADSTGLGDIEFSPFVLGWHLSKNFHCIATVDIFTPVGDYDKNDPSSIGRNYWTISPIFAATYLTDSGFELSGKFMYQKNTENSDTNYTSGDEFICDYLLGQHFGSWNLGLNGFYYKQLTDDEQGGTTIPDNKGQCLSVGPAVQYSYKNMSFSAKLQYDTLVKNRPEGRKLWVKFIYAF
jgi:hypothetical protein